MVETNNRNTSLLQHVFTPLRDFFKDSRAIGIILILLTTASLFLANLSATSSTYIGFWQHPVHFPVPFLHLPETNLLIINDVLMTFFFLLVGMEIKRELTIGELATIKKSLLPVLAALGGMVCPAIIFAVFNKNTPFQHGWGIPMATDIAFSLGVLSLLGKKVPIQIKIFLTALAIIDDLGAVITIAAFYATKISWYYFSAALIIIGLVLLLNKYKFNNLFLYFILGAFLWYCMFNSGIHATLAGVIMGFCLPQKQLATLEHQLFAPVNFVIMPLFALANTAILFPTQMGVIFTSTISYGIIAGLVLGKPLGIFLFSYVAAKLKIATLPAKTTWKQLFGVGMLGGIGFTMSIFTASLAFSENNLQIIAKVAVIVASVISGCLGFAFLYSNQLSTKYQVKDIVLDSEF